MATAGYNRLERFDQQPSGIVNDRKVKQERICGLLFCVVAFVLGMYVNGHQDWSNTLAWTAISLSIVSFILFIALYRESLIGKSPKLFRVIKILLVIIIILCIVFDIVALVQMDEDYVDTDTDSTSTIDTTIYS